MIQVIAGGLLALVACSKVDTVCYAPHVIDAYDVSPLGNVGSGFSDIGKTIVVPVKCGTFGTVAK